MVSSATQKQNDAEVCGEGVPNDPIGAPESYYIPDRKSQKYTNNTTGQIFEFWAGEWH